jgi:hypothetical protein
VHGRDAIFVHWSASFLGADDDWLDRDDIPLLCTKAGASHSGSRKPDIIMDPCESLKTQAMRGLLFGPVRGNLFRFERALLRDFFFFSFVGAQHRVPREQANDITRMEIVSGAPIQPGSAGSSRVIGIGAGSWPHSIRNKQSSRAKRAKRTFHRWGPC